MLHVRWSLMWNVTQHQLGEPSALDCVTGSDLPAFRVSSYLPCYMGQICGLQCYDHLGRICAVLTVQEKAADNFPLEQGSRKADVHQSNEEVPRVNGK